MSPYTAALELNADGDCAVGSSHRDGARCPSEISIIAPAEWAQLLEPPVAWNGQRYTGMLGPIITCPRCPHSQRDIYAVHSMPAEVEATDVDAAIAEAVWRSGVKQPNNCLATTSVNEPFFDGMPALSALGRLRGTYEIPSMAMDRVTHRSAF
jgi:hypothetical protein